MYGKDDDSDNEEKKVEIDYNEDRLEQLKRVLDSRRNMGIGGSRLQDLDS